MGYGDASSDRRILGTGRQVEPEVGTGTMTKMKSFKSELKQTEIFSSQEGFRQFVFPVSTALLHSSGRTFGGCVALK